jgi:hypothetical protein
MKLKSKIILAVIGILAISGFLLQTVSLHTQVAEQKQTQIQQKRISPKIHYPPTTEADLHGLAAKGDVSAIHKFHSENVGLSGVCPVPRIEVTVDQSVTGQKLAEDLLAYFYYNQLDNPCGSLVIAYNNQDEAGGAYTAGRINLDATDSSGSLNSDPNATNLKYTLTLDVGGIDTAQAYTVKY